MKTIPYVWLIDRRACVATYARVKRLARPDDMGGSSR